MTINLIPPRLKKEHEARKVASFTFSGIFVLLVIFLICTGTVYLADGFAKTDLAAAQAKLDEVNLNLKKYADLEKKVDNVNSKISAMNSIDQNRIIWSNVITDLAKSTPIEMQLRTLTVNSTTKSLSISGVAANRTDIAKFKEKMEGSRYFKNVIFASSSLNANTNDYNFSLTCDLEEIK